MNEDLKLAFDAELTEAKALYAGGDLTACFHHLERAHILGQRFYVPHVISHWWMLKVGWRRSDMREIFGQVARIIASAGSLLGWVPAGNTGGANVSPIRPMPIPEDLAVLLANEKEPSLLRFFGRLAATVVAILLLLGAFFTVRHYWLLPTENGQDQLANLSPLTNVGYAKSVTVLPVVNWKAASPDYLTEVGVSYLVTVDGKKILFDLGSNQREETPSPLEANLAQMQMSMDDIDMIFLSHHHFDHIGGQQWVGKNTFATGLQQRPLPEGIRIFAPLPLDYPGRDVTQISRPSVLNNGVASIGPIDRQLFMGRISEQALAVNVEGHGILLLVGCGHQTLAKIVARTQALFEEPIFGIVGDLHYPVPDGRLNFAGINLQRVFASGTGPLSPLAMADVERDLNLLESLNLKLLALGSHDTSDTVLDIAAEKFGPIFQVVEVGKQIGIPSGSRP